MVKTLLLAGVLASFGWLLMQFRQRGADAGRKKVASRKLARKPSDKSPATPAVKTSYGGDWHSVTILSTFNACESAKALEGKGVLATEAPALPLAGCDHETCRCRYDYLDDRRQEDRRSPYGERHGAQIGSNASDRRGPGDRRGVA